MNIGVIILAHKNPEQLTELLRALDNEKVTCVIHIDKNCNLKDYLLVSSKVNSCKVIFLEKRFDGRWGGLGIVLATLEAMRIVLADDKISHISLLSGQDFPIIPIEDIVNFLTSQPNSNFIEFTEFNESTWPGQLDRAYCYNFRLFGKQYTYPYTRKLNFKQKALYQIFKIYFRNPRKIPLNMKPYFGSQWWTLTAQSCKEIINFVNNTPDYLKYHKYSFLPDEFFFQTILLNIAHFKEEEFINDNMRFIKWIKGNPHPITLTSKHFEEILNSGKFFARKFDSEVDPEILIKLDLATNNNVQDNS